MGLMILEMGNLIDPRIMSKLNTTSPGAIDHQLRLLAKRCPGSPMLLEITKKMLEWNLRTRVDFQKLEVLMQRLGLVQVVNPERRIERKKHRRKEIGLE